MKKTTLTKMALLGLAGAIAFALCSFKTIPHEKMNPASIDDEWAEYNKVQSFIRQAILNPIITQDKEHKGTFKAEYFSRCPSGYNSNIAGEPEDVKTSTETFGKIVFYKGCSPKHICDFKVCVEKNEALVKDKDKNDYISVKEWIAGKNKPEAKNSLTKS